MTNAVNSLILAYKISILLGLGLGGYNAFIVGVMSAGAPSANASQMFIGGAIGFLVVAIPMALLPWFAKREVENFATKGHLKIAYTTAFLHTLLGIMSSWIFLPFAVIEIALIYKLRKASKA